MQLHLSVVNTSIRVVTIYRYVAILQYNVVQYNSIYLLWRIDILHRAIYCSELHILCGLELDHWKVNIDKPSFSVWKPKAIKLLFSFKTHWTCTWSSCYWFNNNHICVAIQQCIVNILHTICNTQICHIVTVLTSVAASNTVISIDRFWQKLAGFLIQIYDGPNSVGMFETPSVSATSA